MIKSGDIVEINGKRLEVTGRFAAGRHTRFTLSDGTEALDLDALIEAGKVQHILTGSKVLKGGGGAVVSADEVVKLFESGNAKKSST